MENKELVKMIQEKNPKVVSEIKVKILDKMNEKSNDTSVLPLRQYVKGNTIQKNIDSAIEFFSAGKSTDGAVIIKNEKGIYLIYTSGSGKSMYTQELKSGDVILLQHDQTGRYIGEFDIIGYIDYNNDGIKDIKGASGTDKIKGSFTYK